jgi:type II secretory pathway component PulL
LHPNSPIFDREVMIGARQVNLPALYSFPVGWVLHRQRAAIRQLGSQQARRIFPNVNHHENGRWKFRREIG